MIQKVRHRAKPEAQGKTAAEMFKESYAPQIGVKGLVELPCGTIIYVKELSSGPCPMFMGPAMNEASLSITASALPAYICTSDVS